MSAILAAALWSLHSIGTPAADTPVLGVEQTLYAFGEVWWLIASKTILPIWILLRVIDLACGGPARRRGRVRAQILR